MPSPRSRDAPQNRTNPSNSINPSNSTKLQVRPFIVMPDGQSKKEAKKKKKKQQSGEGGGKPDTMAILKSSTRIRDIAIMVRARRGFKPRRGATLGPPALLSWARGASGPSCRQGEGNDDVGTSCTLTK